MSSSERDHFRGTHLKIHLKSLEKNFLWLQGQTQGFLCPMVKANAYGHGDIQVARKLESLGCLRVGVGLVEEGLGLRKAGVRSEILVFGFHGREAVEALFQNQLVPVVSQLDQLEDIANDATTPVTVHLKLNTGMNRRGLQAFEDQRAQEILQKNPQVQVKGLCTHLLNGEDIDRGEHSDRQIQEFESRRHGFPESGVVFHIYNSAGLAVVREKVGASLYGSRPGLLTYGINPINDQSLDPLISPVMELHSNIVSTQRVKSGEVVSYGGIWTAKRESLIGVLPAGYADGVCRSLSNCGTVLVRGQRVPIVGHVCMDYVMVDLTDLKRASAELIGESAVFFGRQGDEVLRVEEVARVANRTSYEILTGISERVPRLYLE